MKYLTIALFISISFSVIASTSCGRVISVISHMEQDEPRVTFEMELEHDYTGYPSFKKTIKGAGVEFQQKALLRALGDSKIITCYEEQKVTLNLNH